MHLWVRHEQRAHEERVGLTPDGVEALIAAGVKVSVEDSDTRAIPIAGYAAAGARIVAQGGWPEAPRDAVIFGLKELPEDGTALIHRHIMFGHAFKGQPSGRVLLQRFAAGGGRLYDLEYLTDATGRRVAAFGYWAGFAGAAVAYLSWLAQQRGDLAGPVGVYPSASAMIASLKDAAQGVSAPAPRVLIIGALGRVGSGAAALCQALALPVTAWDMAETAHGGPFPQVLEHEIFLNAIFASPGTPVFVAADAGAAARALTVIGDIACDPDSEFSPIKVYDRATDWQAPALRVHDAPPLDVTAIDNLPSLLPVESSEDYAAQLLPTLLALADAGGLDAGPWGRAASRYDQAMRGLENGETI